MAPGRKRGAKGLKSKSELNLGDLVLAKVKGFPAWPAKISRPEEWERAPDPKKYFVQFFGTSEIAFVQPADIQAFTTEAKNKLSARCQGKTVRYFAQAVKEICEEFDVLQCKNLSGMRDDNDAKNLASEAQSVDPVVDEALEDDAEDDANDGIDRQRPKRKLEISESSELSSGFERSRRKDEMECQDVKLCSSDSLSPYMSSGKRSKLSANPTNPVKESVLGSVSSSHGFVKEKSSLDVKVEGWCSDGGQSELASGRQSRLGQTPKKKHDSAMQMKNASGRNMKVSSADNSRSGLDLGCESRGKKLLKEKKHSVAVDGKVDSEITFEEHNEVISRKKMKFQHDNGKQTSQKNEAQTNRNDDKMDDTETERLTSGGKAENHRSFRAQTSNHDPNHSTAEDDPLPTKRQCQTGGMMSNSALISEYRSKNSAPHKNGLGTANKVRSPVMQLPIKRRAVRLCDEDDDELPKTPVHGGFSHKVSIIPRVSESKKKIVMRAEGHANDQVVLKNSGIVDDAFKEKVQSSRLFNKTSLLTAQKDKEKRISESSAERAFPVSHQLDSEKLPLMETKPVMVSPRSVSAVRPLGEPENKQCSKTPASVSQRKTPSGTNKGLATAHGGSSLNQPISERSKPTSPREKRKTAPMSDTQITEPVLFAVNPDESITSHGERSDAGNYSKTSFPVDLKISNPVMPMKHLIAAAQARKRQAHLHDSYINHLPLVVPDADMLGRIPSPTPGTVAVELTKTIQLDVQGLLHPNSPSSDVRQCSSVSEHENEEFERRVSSSHQATGSSLSGDTEAGVARDAFEGMIETLSRTKESIGRATRLAIDCAKYGITNEVVELLVHKLENEPSFHRKVDLFFLVDSITQRAHSQKGIAEASYLPIVQAALPRLIGAAAPNGTGAHENRRQCYKVLRLWLERKIFPESVLRHFMDDIGVKNDEKPTGISQRRPSRAERSIDDPIREMEGLFVDEYGSNTTFQFPGLLPSKFFEEEEEDEDNLPTKSKEVADTSPSEHTPTPSDRRHCILEDVDGELEMEDVSGDQKDERPLFVNDISEVASLEPNSNGTFQVASSMSELLPSPEGSPPLPPGSPPMTPPLPTSPPPQPPPPPSSSPSSPPLPPPPPLSQQHLFPPPPVGPPPFLPQQSLPPQLGLMAPHMPPTGNQHAHMVSNSHGSRIDAPVRGEVFSQQSSFFSPACTSNAREHVGYNSSKPVEYGQSDGYFSTQAAQHRQPFVPGGAPFARRSLHPEPPIQQIPSLFSYSNSVQQNQYPSYALPSFSVDPRRNATDEQWRIQVNEFNSDSQRSGWMTGGRSCSGPPYSHEGYFGTPSLQPSAANSLPPAPRTGHGVQMMPSRPDMSAVNWRPA